MLVSHVLGKPKEYLYINGKKSLSSHQAKSLSSLVARRKKGEPIAYILGYKDFCGLRFKVNKNVLIPRPESEELVHKVYQVCKVYKVSRPLKILDLGTGSGCIAISLSKKLRSATFNLTASDISSTALLIAKQNAKKHHAKIKFIKSDLFKNIKGKFDVIVANLPYVPIKMLNKYMMSKQNLAVDDPFAGLKFEPLSALTDGTLSFQIYRRFFEQVGGHINKGGLILLEIDPSSKKFLIEYQQKNLPSGRMKFYRDFNGLLRYAEIRV